MATLVALKDRVVELEQRWWLTVGGGAVPMQDAPLPPFPWAVNAASGNAATASGGLR